MNEELTSILDSTNAALSDLRSFDGKEASVQAQLSLRDAAKVALQNQARIAELLKNLFGGLTNVVIDPNEA